MASLRFEMIYPQKPDLEISEPDGTLATTVEAITVLFGLISTKTYNR